jgi:hypothetical protein
MERDPHCGDKKLRSSKLGPRAPISEKLSLRWRRRGAPAMSAESTEAVLSSSCNMTALSRRSCSSSITLCSARLARRVSSVIFHNTRARLLWSTHSDSWNPCMYHESWKPELLANMINCNILENGSVCRRKQLTTRRHSCCTTTSRSRSAPGKQHPIWNWAPYELAPGFLEDVETARTIWIKTADQGTIHNILVAAAQGRTVHMLLHVLCHPLRSIQADQFMY